MRSSQPRSSSPDRSTHAPSDAWDRAREEQHRVKREAILKAASECLNEAGYAGTSLADVAQRLNVTHNALYYYFKNKEDLVLHCFLRSISVIEGCIEDAEASGSTGLEKIEHFARNLLVAGGAASLPIVSRASGLGAGNRQTLQRGARAHHRRVRAFVEEGVRDGSIRECDTTIATWMILHALYWAPSEELSKYSPEQFVEGVVDFVTGSLRTR
jgi:AcrR family transcriptional regulator